MTTTGLNRLSAKGHFRACGDPGDDGRDVSIASRRRGTSGSAPQKCQDLAGLQGGFSQLGFSALERGSKATKTRRIPQ